MNLYTQSDEDEFPVRKARGIFERLLNFFNFSNDFRVIFRFSKNDWNQNHLNDFLEISFRVLDVSLSEMRVLSVNFSTSVSKKSFEPKSLE